MSLSTECVAALLSFRYASCCGASGASEQQYKSDFYEEYLEGETNSRIHHFLPECIAFNQTALRQFLPECIVVFVNVVLPSPTPCCIYLTLHTAGAREI